MDWKEELLKRLDALAAKLGTTAEYLWRVLVKQAYISGISDALVALLCCIAAVICYKMVMYAWRIPNTKDRYGDLSWPDRKGGLFIPFLIVGCLALIFSCIFLISAIPQLANPEYYALHEVLQTLGH